MKTARWLLPLLLLLLAVGMLHAADFIPVPDLSSKEIPQTQNPAPRADWREYLDLAALVAGLSLATLFALVLRWRSGLFLLAIASLAWLGFWRAGCICPIGAIQNITLAIADPGYAVPLTVVAIFVLPLIMTLFFGRTFCAAVCPLGAVQEIVALRPQRVPAWLDHALGLLAYVYLGLAVMLAATGAGFLICRYDPFVALFRMSGSREMLLVAAGFLAVGVFIGRPYCRWLCPYGAILGLASRLSRWHVRIPPKDCIQCRLCEDACPYGAIREPTVLQPIAQRRTGRWRLAAMIALLPGLIALGSLLGSGLGTPLSWLHPRVALAERVAWEERQRVDTGQLPLPSDASESFRNSGQPIAKLYATALDMRGRMKIAGVWFGAWVGLVVGVKLIHLSVRRRRNDYQPDRAGCVACGRCFWYCPSEQARRGWIQDRSPFAPRK